MVEQIAWGGRKPLRQEKLDQLCKRLQTEPLRRLLSENHEPPRCPFEFWIQDPKQHGIWSANYDPQTQTYFNESFTPSRNYGDWQPHWVGFLLGFVGETEHVAFVTDEPELIEHLRTLVFANVQRPDYLAQPDPEDPNVPLAAWFPNLARVVVCGGSDGPGEL